ncbi:MAG: exo-alpha-sialidase [Lentimicrobium sp.]|nr:exo-alpha-sialidase [Lentimicrobium sp.]
MEKIKDNYFKFKMLLLIFLIMTTIAFQCEKETGIIKINLSSTELVQLHIPLFLGKTDNGLVLVKFSIDDSVHPLILEKITFQFQENSQISCISSLSVTYSGSEPEITKPFQFGSTSEVNYTTVVIGKQLLLNGDHVFSVKFDGNPNADILSFFNLNSVSLDFESGESHKIIADENYSFGVAKVLRAEGQDDCNTYRIPGIITTNKGTLVAVYDIRYSGSGDLQGDIDVGMSRSTDGGNTWEPMKLIMDMGEWGALPEEENGIGDPCILFDPMTNTIWVAALWYHGNAGKSAWSNSKPGLEPSETGQFMLAKSTDDGHTWSAPINITQQVKNPEWHLFFQGPGRGISMEDGTLVFPAQFKDAEQVPYSTLIFSKDHGQTWQVGSGAKPQTTEAQVVQLEDGSLMLNMRDDLNRTEKGPANGRAVSDTKDLGKTWTTHQTSNSALPEPNCMASLISSQSLVNGKMQQVLFFSNPNDKISRIHMTIKASTDQGNSWPESLQYEFYSPESFGYSCMTMVDEETIGILYEGLRSLYFQKIPVSRIVKH